MPTRPFAVVELDSAPIAQDRFRRWVNTYGVSRLGRSLQTDRRTIHSWLHRVHPYLPSIERVRIMIALSTIEPLHDGPLTYEDFYGEVKILNQRHQFHGRTRERQILTRRVI